MGPLRHLINTGPGVLGKSRNNSVICRFKCPWGAYSYVLDVSFWVFSSCSGCELLFLYVHPEMSWGLVQGLLPTLASRQLK